MVLAAECFCVDSARRLKLASRAFTRLLPFFIEVVGSNQVIERLHISIMLALEFLFSREFSSKHLVNVLYMLQLSQHRYVDEQSCACSGGVDMRSKSAYMFVFHILLAPRYTGASEVGVAVKS